MSLFDCAVIVVGTLAWGLIILSVYSGSNNTSLNVTQNVNSEGIKTSWNDGKSSTFWTWKQLEAMKKSLTND